MEKDKFVKLWKGDDKIKLMFIKSLLESEGIVFFVENEHINSVFPIFPYIIYVAREDEERAKKMLEEQR